MELFGTLCRFPRSCAVQLAYVDLRRWKGESGLFLCVADITVHGRLRNRNRKLVTSLAPVSDSGQKKKSANRGSISSNAPRRSGGQRHLRTITQSKQYCPPHITHVILAALAILNVLTGTGTSLYGSKAWIEKLDLSYELNGHRGCVNTLSYEIPIGNYGLIGGIDGVKKASISSREVMTIDCSSGLPTTSLLSEKYSTRVHTSLP